MPADVTVTEAAALRWTKWMLHGDFESAWRESELIDGTGYQDPHRLWNGESWAGKRVMLRCLHGLGDAIQFIRYAPLLRETCRSLTVQSHPELVRLMEMVPGVDQAVTWGKGESDWEIQMEITELPRAFHTSLATIPVRVPYIFVSDKQRIWAAELIPRNNKINVGLVWQASTWNPKRSIPVAALVPLLSAPSCEFFILQKEAKASIAAHDLQSGVHDVADTAALMTQLDLIITVDTMTAHLAGALGRPVWILLPFESDWRWMLKRSDSPWYPSATLFRQQKPDDWSSVIDAATAKLIHGT